MLKRKVNKELNKEQGQGMGRRKGQVKSELSMEPRSGKIIVISAWKKEGTSED